MSLWSITFDYQNQRYGHCFSPTELTLQENRSQPFIKPFVTIWRLAKSLGVPSNHTSHFTIIDHSQPCIKLIYQPMSSIYQPVKKPISWSQPSQPFTTICLWVKTLVPVVSVSPKICSVIYGGSFPVASNPYQFLILNGKNLRLNPMVSKISLNPRQ